MIFERILNSTDPQQLATAQGRPHHPDETSPRKRAPGVPSQSTSRSKTKGYVDEGFPWLGLVLIAGCSSPYQFSSEIGNFSIGVDHVSNAYTAGYDNLANDRQAYRDLIFDDASAKLKLANACNPAVPSALPCDFYSQGEPQPSPSDPALESSRQETLDALTALTDYAHALEAVTNAADRAAFDSAASRLNASVTGLLAKIPSPPVVASSAVISAGFNIFAWVLGQALE